jgi:DNA-binding LytR/AlgR family response regulator
MPSQLSNFLKQPYPDKDDMASVVAGSLSAGVIVGGALFYLRPFGLDQAGPKLLQYSVQFGLISSAVCFAFDLVVRFGFGIRRDTERWSLWKWMITVSALIVCISAANYVFISKTFGDSFSLKGFAYVLYTTVVIGVFPVSILGMVNLLRNLRMNQRIAASIRPKSGQTVQGGHIELPIQNSTKTLAVDVSKILYIEAMQNYVRIVFKEEAGMEPEILRNTIATIEAILKDTPVKRCHRSFLVNTFSIEHVDGNAQGLKLKLDKLPEPYIPVSRKYIADFRN